LLGTFLGNTFGHLFQHDHTVSYNGYSTIELDPGHDHFGDGDLSGYTSNGSYQVLDQMEHTVQNVATAAAHTVNQFVDAIGGHVLADLPLAQQFHFANSSNGTSAIGIDTYQLVTDDDPESPSYGSQVPHYLDTLNNRDNLTGQQVVNYAAMQALKYIEIEGGNIYMKRVLDHSHATTLDQLAGELKVAEDYGWRNFPVWQLRTVSGHSTGRRII